MISLRPRVGFLCVSIGLVLLCSSCRPPTPESERARFERTKLAAINIPEVAQWARGELASEKAIGFRFSPSNYPPSLSKAPPLVCQIVTDTASDARFVLMIYRMGLIREGIMIGAPGSQVGTRGYRFEITNGVFYVFDHN
jgi:hypothetical protein